MIGTLGSMSREDVSASSSAASIDSALSGSSWTPYIVDFLTHDGQEKGEFSSSFNDDDDDERHSSSVVSDAATIVSNGNHVRVRAGGPERTLKNLKKRKTKEESLVDEALEDTASSPHASPKVCGFRLPDIYPKKRELESLMAKGNVSEQTSYKVKNGGDLVVGRRGEYCDQSSELKKQGLRLVPVSVVLKYQLG